MPEPLPPEPQLPEPAGEPIRVVTISASFGAGGSQVAPRLAKRLGWAFLDRAIPYQVAERLAMPLEEALARDDQEDTSRLRWLLSSFRNLDPAGAPATLATDEGPRDDFVAATEAVLRDAAGRGRVVVLGRAAAVVLGERPGLLHVRLDGPVDRRVAQAAAVTRAPADVTRRQLERADRAREAYVRRIYREDPKDVRLYHVLIDSTRVPLISCVAALAALIRPAG